MMFFVMVLLTALNINIALADEDFDHSRFYQAKNAVRQELIETVKQIGFSATESDFKDELDKRLSWSANKNPGMDYTVLTSTMDDAIIIITLIGYDDEKGFVGWKFDTIVVDNAAYFFSITLPDRQIPEIGPEDYYQWHRMKKG
jgi:hypothetical protein